MTLKLSPPHCESLARLGLVRHMLTDPGVKILPRAIDANWSYDKVVLQLVTGFNPLKLSVFYAANSQLAHWLQAPHRSARDFNAQDRLIGEVIGAVHDYLHSWANHAVTEVLPHLGYGIKPITEKNFEDFVFCHIVTEVAASIGTDYWFVCNLDINTELDIGTNFGPGYQTRYHERDLAEYRLFNPQLTVQTKEFFHYFSQIYLSGFLEGFDLNAVMRSAKVSGWLVHEIGYGELVRIHTRNWFAHLSGKIPPLSEEQLSRELAVDKPWKKKLLHEMADLLWEKTKQDKLHHFRKHLDREKTWTSEGRPCDFRFVNLNRVPIKSLGEESFRLKDKFYFDCFLTQLLSNLEYEKVDRELLSFIPLIKYHRDFKLATHLFERQPRMPSVRREPYDLFVLP